MRVTAKGQVTIPADIRERAGLRPHTHVECTFDGKDVRIRRAAEGKASGHNVDLVERLRGSGDIRMTTDEIMALTRGE